MNYKMSNKHKMKKKKIRNGGDKREYTSFLQEAHIARRVSDTFAQNLTITHTRETMRWST